jgi:hypothetical protein
MFLCRSVRERSVSSKCSLHTNEPTSLKQRLWGKYVSSASNSINCSWSGSDASAVAAIQSNDDVVFVTRKGETYAAGGLS